MESVFQLVNNFIKSDPAVDLVKKIYLLKVATKSRSPIKKKHSIQI